MRNHIPDMNRDGKVDNHDTALFHEMLDEDHKDAQCHRTPSGSVGSSPRTIHDSMAKTLLLLLFGGIALLCVGVFPINGFAAVLALLSAVCFIRTLLL